MSESIDPLWYILEKIQKDIDRIEEKQDTHLVTSTKLISQLDGLAVKVTELNKLLTMDNGKPSIVSQVNLMVAQVRQSSDEVTEIKSLVNKLGTDLQAVQTHIGVPTPKEVSVERWKTLGLIGAAFAGVLPGVLSFIHNFL